LAGTNQSGGERGNFRTEKVLGYRIRGKRGGGGKKRKRVLFWGGLRQKLVMQDKDGRREERRGKGKTRVGRKVLTTN